jgi:hypothetical protein
MDGQKVVMAMEKSDYPDQVDEKSKKDSNAVTNLAAGKRELKDLIEGGVLQPDDRVIALRTENQMNQQIVDESAKIQKGKSIKNNAE